MFPNHWHFSQPLSVPLLCLDDALDSSFAVCVKDASQCEVRDDKRIEVEESHPWHDLSWRTSYWSALWSPDEIHTPRKKREKQSWQDRDRSVQWRKDDLHQNQIDTFAWQWNVFPVKEGCCRRTKRCLRNRTCLMGRLSKSTDAVKTTAVGQSEMKDDVTFSTGRGNDLEKLSASAGKSIVLRRSSKICLAAKRRRPSWASWSWRPTLRKRFRSLRRISWSVFHTEGKEWQRSRRSVRWSNMFCDTKRRNDIVTNLNRKHTPRINSHIKFVNHDVECRWQIVKAEAGSYWETNVRQSEVSSRRQIALKRSIRMPVARLIQVTLNRRHHRARLRLIRRANSRWTPQWERE